MSKAGGLGTSLRNLVVYLARAGVQVTVFVIQQKSTERFEEAGISFHLLAKRSYPFLGWFRYRKWVESYINRSVREEGIDVLEAPDWTGITAFMQFRVPLVVRFHGSDTYFCQLEGRKQKWKNRWFEKNAVQRAQAFIAPTTYAGRESAKLFGLDPKRVQTIHYGLDLSLFENRDPSNFVPYRLLNAGTLIRKKGVFELIAVFNKVAAAHQQVELYLIGADSPDITTGSASTWELMEQQILPEFRSRVHYLGKVPYQDMQAHIRQAQLCIFPSKAETLGMVTIESMAMQKTVINTNYGWAQELIDHGRNGFKLDPTAIQAQADLVLELLADADRCLQIGKEARQKVEATFDIQDIVQQNYDFYKTVIHADRRRA